MVVQSNEHIAQLQREHEQRLLEQQQAAQWNFTLELTKRAEYFSEKQRQEDRDWNQLNVELNRNLTATHHQKEFEFRETVELAGQRGMAQERQQHEWTLEQYRSQRIEEHQRHEQFRQDEHDLDKFLDTYNLTRESIPLLQRKVLSLLRRFDVPHKTLLIQILNDANLLLDNNTDLPRQRISLAGVNLNGIQLGNKDGMFCPSQYFDQLDLDRATLIGASFDCLSLRNTSFRWANLTYASLTRSDLRDSNFGIAKLHNTSFQESQLDRGRFPYGSLVGADFRQASLINASLAFADIIETDFSEAKLDAAIFLDAQLNGVNFERANLHKAKLDTAKLVHANFYQANGGENSFRFTNITDAIFRQAHFIQSDFYGAEGNRTDFSKAILDDSELLNVKLEEAIFEDASMARVKSQLNQVFSLSKAILPDGSIGKNKNLIRNGNPTCDESMTMNISQWTVPVQGSIIIVPQVNDDNCVFQATTSNITHLIQSVDVSHYVKRMMNAGLTYVLLEANIITNNIKINLRFFNSTDNLVDEGIHDLVVSF
ncbi:unnamed protein product [Rotaria sp. Silwood1]|nr:unnamed protein product [Rotaria sp. Silwood1]CAF1630767.1 unnamed protein product [Rotaria sp. Silwood1]